MWFLLTVLLTIVSAVAIGTDFFFFSSRLEWFYEYAVARRLREFGIPFVVKESGDDTTADKDTAANSIEIRPHSGFFRDVFWNPSLGFGEGYMNGSWQPTSNLVDFSRFVMSSQAYSLLDVSSIASKWLSRLANLQDVASSMGVAEKHYNIGKDLFDAMLGPTMQYSCAYWPPKVDGSGFSRSETRSLSDIEGLTFAQERKMRLICEKLQLRKGMTVLDIGCGWGGLLHYMQKNYGVKGVGVTIAKEQIALGKTKFPDVEFVEMDYRTFCASSNEKFDRVVSVGFFEHVGYKNYRSYFEHVRKVLAPNGVTLLHTIGGNRSTTKGNDWMDRYIFPGGMLPSIKQIGEAIENLFVLEDWQANMGPHYARTLDVWMERSNRFFNENPHAYDARFQRMWMFYLATCLVAFEQRKIQLWQIVLTPNGYADERGRGLPLPRVS